MTATTAGLSVNIDTHSIACKKLMTVLILRTVKQFQADLPWMIPNV